MTEAWFRSSCPQCESENWVCDGDPSDVTGFDLSGVKCWKCGNCWPLDPEFGEEEFDPEHCELGRHFEEVKA